MSRQKKYSRRERFYSALISALCLCAVVLVIAIVVDNQFNPVIDAQPETTRQPVISDATPKPLTLKLELPPTVAPEATDVPEAAPTPVPKAAYEFLPVYTRANTEEKVIAITLDGCTNAGHLKTVMERVHSMGGKLTLFPYGQSTMKDGMAELIRIAVNQLGWEVENRTWSNQLVYKMSSSDMATEIWSADMAVDYALNMDYDMHLFRMRGGSGAVDVRTHEYLKQLGYDGIVNWAVSGSVLSSDTLHNRLNPGYIYHFDFDNESLTKLLSFMEFAIDRGYRCVTVNELLGFPANRCVEPEEAILSRILPLPEAYDPIYVDHKIGDRAWQVLLIQTRLGELGYLDPEGADGIYGEGTSSAVSQFQVQCGLLGTGVATAETQEILFSDEAPAKNG